MYSVHTTYFHFISFWLNPLTLDPLCFLNRFRTWHSSGCFTFCSGKHELFTYSAEIGLISYIQGSLSVSSYHKHNPNAGRYNIVFLNEPLFFSDEQFLTPLTCTTFHTSLLLLLGIYCRTNRALLLPKLSNLIFYLFFLCSCTAWDSSPDWHHSCHLDSGISGGVPRALFDLFEIQCS